MLPHSLILVNTHSNIYDHSVVPISALYEPLIRSDGAQLTKLAHLMQFLVGLAIDCVQ